MNDEAITFYLSLYGSMSEDEFTSFMNSYVTNPTLVMLSGKTAQYVARKKREHNMQFFIDLYQDYKDAWDNNAVTHGASETIDSSVRELQQRSRNAFSEMERIMHELRQAETATLRKMRQEVDFTYRAEHPTPEDKAKVKAKAETVQAPIFKNPLDAFYEEQERLRAEQRNKG